MKFSFFNVSALLLVIITMVNCEKDNTPNDDEILKLELIGSWKGVNNATKYNFLENNNYTDSLFWAWETDTLEYVINGKYYINNGYLQIII